MFFYSLHYIFKVLLVLSTDGRYVIHDYKLPPVRVRWRRRGRREWHLGRALFCGRRLERQVGGLTLTAPVLASM